MCYSNTVDMSVLLIATADLTPATLCHVLSFLLTNLVIQEYRGTALWCVSCVFGLCDNSIITM